MQLFRSCVCLINISLFYHNLILPLCTLICFICDISLPVSPKPSICVETARLRPFVRLKHSESINFVWSLSAEFSYYSTLFKLCTCIIFFRGLYILLTSIYIHHSTKSPCWQSKCNQCCTVMPVQTRHWSCCI